MKMATGGRMENIIISSLILWLTFPQNGRLIIFCVSDRIVKLNEMTTSNDTVSKFEGFLNDYFLDYVMDQF